MSSQTLQWIGFNVFILLMLVLDLAVFHRNKHQIKIKEALLWTAMWVSLAFLFGYGIYHYLGREKALEFLTGYLIEESLSIDNIFVFVLIFSYFKVPAQYQHSVLFWGIMGALVMRLTFIFTGIAIINKFHWVIYLFASFLIFTAIKMLVQDEKKINPGKNPVIRLFKKIFPVTDSFHGNRFFVRINSKTYATPLFVTVLMIEVSDLIFAVDSIPAILAISNDRFIVYTSNVFAILGLRSLYFAVAGIYQYFHYLKYGLSAILIFVGIKMCLTDIYKIPVLAALVVIAAIIIFSVTASLIVKPKKKLSS